MPKNLLAGHPPWRQLLIVSLALPTVVVAAVLAFAWPAARLQPRELPVGIVGSNPGSEQVVTDLSAAEPGAFDFRLYADGAAARDAIDRRDIYGAFVVASDHVEVLTASAASPAVASLLDTVGTQLAVAPTGDGRPPLRLVTHDVVPLSADDPKGLVFGSGLLPLTICSILVAAGIGVLVKFRPAWRQILALTVVSAVAGAGAYLISQTFLGALPHEAGADWAGLALTILAVSAATAGFIALIGPVGMAIAAAVMVFLGNPFSGATSAPELLPSAVDHIGRWLPPGAGANLLRSTAYFHGDGATSHVVVLTIWIVLGFAAIALGHHPPIRFAAHSAGQAAAARRPEQELGRHEVDTYQHTPDAQTREPQPAVSV